MSIDELARSIQSVLSVIHSPISNNEQRKSAQESLDTLVTGPNEKLLMPACLQLLQGIGDGASCHFALSTISKFVRFSSQNLSEQEWNGLKGGLLSLFAGSANLPYFVSSKLIDVICEVAIRLWPSDWSELLTEVMAANPGLAICLFARICDCLSEESLSVRCIAPERQSSLRVGISQIAESLCVTCLEYVKTPEGSGVPNLQWIIELLNGLSIATKQSSFLIKHGLHQVVLSAFVNCQEPSVKMLSVECLSNFIHYLNGQSGRAYTIARGTRDQDRSMLQGILTVCRSLLEPTLLKTYFEEEEMRDPTKAFFELLTDIRKTANIFSYFNSLYDLTNVLIDTALLHPSIPIQTSALANLDAMLRTKNIVTDRRLYSLCFVACHDYYSAPNLDLAPIPPEGLVPYGTNKTELNRRRELFHEEVEEEDTKAPELIGKLKNAALLCVRHIATTSSMIESFCNFLREVLNDTIRKDGVTKSYSPALLVTEALATTLPSNDPKINEVSAIVDIVCSTCPSGSEQDYLWFIGKAGGLISANCIQGVFQTLLRMDIASNFPVQVAFISLCKANPHCAIYSGALHEALMNALGGETRSWAIGAVLSASSHGGIGAADGYATTVYADAKQKLDAAVTLSGNNIEEFAKKSTPIFATLKAILEVPLSPAVAGQIANEIASTIVPFYWQKIMRSPGIFELAQNEFLAVLGAQFVQTAQNNSNSYQANACFQLYLVLTQTAGLCFPLLTKDSQGSFQSLLGLFDPSWGLRASLLNILLSNVAVPGGRSWPSIIFQMVLPQAFVTLNRIIQAGNHDDFTASSISRASITIIQVMLTALQITTDEESSMSEFSGAPKPVLTQRQLKAQMRSRNRFAAISEDAMVATPQAVGPKIPYEVVRDPQNAFTIVRECISFRTDKALRRISQTLPTIVTRWWNTVSHDGNLAGLFLAAIVPSVLEPIVQTLEMVRLRDPSTIPGGQLYSYTCERAVSGRKLASELVEHSSVTIHGILSVLWRYSTGGRPGQSIDPIALVSSTPVLSQAVKILLDGCSTPISNESIMRVVGCAREQSLESRATLKYIVHTISTGEIQSESGSATPRGAATSDKGVIRATSKDLLAPPPSNSPYEDVTHPDISIF
jgi:hypothetical protein